MIRDGGGIALTLLFAALLIGGLVLMVLVGIRVLLGGISHPADRDAPQESANRPAMRSEARRVLDERYARGELSTKEYREHVENLGEEA